MQVPSVPLALGAFQAESLELCVLLMEGTQGSGLGKHLLLQGPRLHHCPPLLPSLLPP